MRLWWIINMADVSHRWYSRSVIATTAEAAVRKVIGRPPKGCRFVKCAVSRGTYVAICNPEDDRVASRAYGVVTEKIQ